MERFGHDVWTLVKDYWVSQEGWSAWPFLAAIIGLDMANVYINVRLNVANGVVFNALQQNDSAAFFHAFGSIIALILAPDQRIAEDVRLFIEHTLSMGLGLLFTLAMLASFSVILWNLAGSITLSIGGLALSIPGYMCWVAVLYSGVGSVMAHLVGRPLIHLNNRQRGVEADFRFSLVRLREEAEGIALYGGEEQERGIALGRFQAVYDNVKRLIRRNCQFLTFQLFVSQFANFFPLLVAAPRFFAGAITLGVLTQITNAFWQALEAQQEGVGARLEAVVQQTIDLQEVGAALPDGTPLIAPGQRWTEMSTLARSWRR